MTNVSKSNLRCNSSVSFCDCDSVELKMDEVSIYRPTSDKRLGNHQNSQYRFRRIIIKTMNDISSAIDQYCTGVFRLKALNLESIYQSNAFK